MTEQRPESERGDTGLWMPDGLAEIDNCIAKAKEDLAALESRREALMKRSLVACYHCGAANRLGNLTYIQTHFYVTPSGCTGGDYWLPGEGRYQCPSCSRTNRLIDCFNRAEVGKLKRYFAMVEDRHDKRLWLGR